MNIFCSGGAGHNGHLRLFLDPRGGRAKTGDGLLCAEIAELRVPAAAVGHEEGHERAHAVHVGVIDDRAAIALPRAQSPARAKIARFVESVFGGHPIASASVPAGTPPGSRRMSKRKISESRRLAQRR